MRRRSTALRINAAAEVEKFPSRASGDVQVFSPEEVWALVRAAGSEQDAAVFLTAAFTGLRMGELLALLGRREHWTGDDDLVSPARPAAISTAPRSAARYKLALAAAGLRPLRFRCGADGGRPTIASRARGDVTGRGPVNATVSVRVILVLSGSYVTYSLTVAACDDSMLRMDAQPVSARDRRVSAGRTRCSFFTSSPAPRSRPMFEARRCC